MMNKLLIAQEFDPGDGGGNSTGNSYDVGPIKLDQVYNFATDPTTAGSAKALDVYFSVIISTFTVLAGIFLLLFFIMGAFSWITARGDSESLEKARSQMLNAILGFILVVITWFFVKLIGDILGIDIVNPTWYIVTGANSPQALTPVQ